MLSTPKAKGGLFLASSLCDGLEDNDIKQVTTLLLNNEADPNVLIPSHGVTPFHLVIGNDSEAFAEEVTKLFLRHGGNPNVRSSDGLTPVHVAAAWGRVAVLELLLANGGDPLRVDDEGRNPFHYAFDGKYYKVITLLGKYCEDSSDNEKNAKFTMAFDKLVINNGDVMAEYVAPMSSELDDQETIDESDSKFKLEVPASSPNADTSFNSTKMKPLKGCSSPWLPVRKGTGRKHNRDQAELELQQVMEKEKHLVNKIIDQLSTSLKSKQKDRLSSERKIKYEYSETSLSTDENIPEQHGFNDTTKSYLKRKVKTESNGTPKRTRKVSTQSSRKLPTTPRFSERNTAKSICDRVPLTPLYYNDMILSKSPNLKINCEAYINNLDGNRYLSPKVTKKELFHQQKAFTPSSARCNDSNRFDELRRLGKEEARSTPRKKKFYHHRTPLRKLQKNYNSSDTLDSSPDSVGYFSPKTEGNRNRNPRRIEDRLIVKLDGNKYDDDDPVKRDEDLDNLNYRLKSLAIVASREKCANYSSDNDRQGKHEGTLNSSDSQIKHSSGFNSRESFESVNNIPSEDERCVPTVPSKENIDKNFNNIRTILRPERTAVSNNTSWDNSSLASFRSARSFISVQEDFKYEDIEEGVAFLERRLYIVPSTKSEDEDFDRDSISTFRSTYSTMQADLPAEFQALSNQVLRQRLADLGQNPGPITVSTRNVYLKRLVKLEKLGERGTPLRKDRILIDGNIVNIKATLRYGDWVDQLHSCRILEKNTFNEFMNPDPSRRWREGVNKSSFNYLLLDPRITNDLSCRAVELSEAEIWHTFLSAIFYIGKGKKTRPYAHLYDAFNAFCSTGREKPAGKKIQRILDIWNEGQGVVCLHVFHNIIPVEAYTREALMIEAVSLDQLCNQKGGEYYGLAATWNIKEKFRFGRYLLYRAMQILLHDGERQLRPDHL